MTLRCLKRVFVDEGFPYGCCKLAPGHTGDCELLTAWDETKEKIEAVLRSLDKVCSACMAATDQATWELLHHGRVCPNKLDADP